MKFKPSFAWVSALVKFIPISCALVACDENKHQSLVWMQEQEKIDLSHQVELKNYRFEQADTGGLAHLQQVRLQIKRNAGTLAAIQQRKAVASVQLDLLVNQWAQLRETTIAERRQLALGREFTQLKLVSGRQFENVSIVSIDDIGVAIRHSNGSARLRYSDLNETQRVLFGIEADSAKIALKNETAERTAYERSIVKRIAMIQETQALEVSLKKEAELANSEKKAALKAQLAISSESLASKPRALAEPAVPVGSRTSASYYNSYYRNRYRSSNYVYYYTPTVYTTQPFFGQVPSQNPIQTYTPTVPIYPYHTTPNYSPQCNP